MRVRFFDSISDIFFALWPRAHLSGLNPGAISVDFNAAYFSDCNFVSLSLVAVSELIDYRTGMGLIARHMHIHWPYGHFGITSSLFLSMLFRSIDHKGNEPRRRVESDAVNTVVVVYLWLLNAVNVLRRRL